LIPNITIQSLRATIFAGNTRLLFLGTQVVFMGVLALPIWICGLVYFFTAEGKRYRLFGYLFLTVLLVLTVFRAKPYYAAPAYPMLFGAGGAWLGCWFESRRVAAFVPCIQQHSSARASASA
jgi:hypothetical protein